MHYKFFRLSVLYFRFGLLMKLRGRDVVNSGCSSRQRSVLPDSVHSFPDPSGEFRRLSVECLTLCSLVTERQIDVTVTADAH